jgi:hypothetical protein
MLERYFIPLAPFVLLAATALLGLFYFACLEKELGRLKSRLRGPREVESTPSLTMKSNLEELNSRLEDLNARVQNVEDRAGMAVPPPPRASLNLNKRTQVIRMSRRGEATEYIAASLSIPRREVELLLKVYALALDGSNGNSS